MSHKSIYGLVLLYILSINVHLYIIHIIYKCSIKCHTNVLYILSIYIYILSISSILSSMVHSGDLWCTLEKCHINLQSAPFLGSNIIAAQLRGGSVSAGMAIYDAMQFVPCAWEATDLDPFVIWVHGWERTGGFNGDFPGFSWNLMDCLMDFHGIYWILMDFQCIFNGFSMDFQWIV